MVLGCSTRQKSVKNWSVTLLTEWNFFLMKRYLYPYHKNNEIFQPWKPLNTPPFGSELCASVTVPINLTPSAHKFLSTHEFTLSIALSSHFSLFHFLSFRLSNCTATITAWTSSPSSTTAVSGASKVSSSRAGCYCEEKKRWHLPEEGSSWKFRNIMSVCPPPNVSRSLFECLHA